MDCDQTRELMNGYIDGVLTEADSAAFEEHISCCENCHEEYDMLKKISADLANTASPLPVGFADRLHCALVQEKLASEKKHKPIFRYYRMASGIAAALVIAAVGKFGVYDTYKKVTNDTANMAVQIANGSKKDTVAPVENIDAPLTEENVAEVTVTNKTEEPAPYVAEPTPAAEKPAPRVTEPTPAAEKPVPRVTEPTSAAEEPAPYVTEPTSAAEESAPGVTESAPQTEDFTADTAPAEAPLTASFELEEKIYDKEPVLAYNMTKTDSVMGLGGNTIEVTDDEDSVEKRSDIDKEPVQTDAADDTVIATEPIPAVMELYDNDEATILSVKERLLTIVEESAITHTDNSITVTVSADDYDNTVSRIGEIEHIKSVGHGVPLDGVGIIIIR